MPPAGPPEIVFAGRSNVGKSSAINALLGRKRLAFTSKTPGRTQTVNFYDLCGGTARLVDLPGYGFARVPHAVREQWEALVASYLESREAIAGIVVVMDARHPLTPLDHQLIAWLRAPRLLLLLSKADKLSRNEQAGTLKKLVRPKGAEAQLFSSLTRQGLEETRDLLEQWLATVGATLPQAAEIKNPR